MKNILLSISVLVFTVLCGCTTVLLSRNLNSITLGMPKAEVIAFMGPPESTSAQGRLEYLNYKLETAPGYWHETMGLKDYFIRLVDGKVESYGKVGDFDSTKIPETKLELDVK